MLSRTRSRFRGATRGDGRVGTDHIALAMLSDPDSDTARALGVELQQARAALQALDREALATVGMDAPADAPALPAR